VTLSRLSLRRKTIGLMGLALLAGATPALAAGPEASTGCEFRNFISGYYITDKRRVFDADRFSAFVHKLDTAVYEQAAGDAGAPQTLRFGQRVGIVDPGEGTQRLKVRDSGGQPLGWVDRSALLCNMYPMSDPATGLYRQAIVRAGAAEFGLLQRKDVYHSPDERCEGGASGCRQVTRVQRYFIYAEENGHYLIAESANLASSATRLLGWLPDGDAYVWSTGLGLRSSATVDHICAYGSREELASGSGCIEIPGGLRWLALSERLLVVGFDGDVYEVIFPEFRGVRRAFVRQSADVVPEVLLTRDGLQKLIHVLEAFKTFAVAAHGIQGRARLVNVLLVTIGSVLQVDFDDGQIPLARMLELAAGLPLGGRSKLMQYSVDELRDASRVPACEIDYLAAYAARKHDVLNIVLQGEGRLLAQFSESRWPEGTCPNLSEKGRNIPFIEGAVRPRAIGNAGETTAYSMMHTRGNESFFWIPVSYLP
jgi:hypothetical protein